MRYTLLAAVLLVTACAEQPRRPVTMVNVSDTSRSWERDHYECQREASASFPVTLAPTVSHGQAQCANGVCDETTTHASRDVNLEARQALGRECLRLRGWRPMRDGKWIDPADR